MLPTWAPCEPSQRNLKILLRCPRSSSVDSHLVAVDLVHSHLSTLPTPGCHVDHGIVQPLNAVLDVEQLPSLPEDLDGSGESSEDCALSRRRKQAVNLGRNVGKSLATGIVFLRMSGACRRSDLVSKVDAVPASGDHHGR